MLPQGIADNLKLSGDRQNFDQEHNGTDLLNAAISAGIFYRH